LFINNSTITTAQHIHWAHFYKVKCQWSPPFTKTSVIVSTAATSSDAIVSVNIFSEISEVVKDSLTVEVTWDSEEIPSTSIFSLTSTLVSSSAILFSPFMTINSAVSADAASVADVTAIFSDFVDAVVVLLTDDFLTPTLDLAAVVLVFDKDLVVLEAAEVPFTLDVVVADFADDTVLEATADLVVELAVFEAVVAEVVRLVADVVRLAAAVELVLLVVDDAVLEATALLAVFFVSLATAEVLAAVVVVSGFLGAVVVVGFFATVEVAPLSGLLGAVVVGFVEVPFTIFPSALSVVGFAPGLEVLGIGLLAVVVAVDFGAVVVVLGVADGRVVVELVGRVVVGFLSAVGLESAGLVAAGFVVVGLAAVGLAVVGFAVVGFAVAGLAAIVLDLAGAVFEAAALVGVGVPVLGVRVVGLGVVPDGLAFVADAALEAAGVVLLNGVFVVLPGVVLAGVFALTSATGDLGFSIWAGSTSGAA